MNGGEIFDLTQSNDDEEVSSGSFTAGREVIDKLLADSSAEGNEPIVIDGDAEDTTTALPSKRCQSSARQDTPNAGRLLVNRGHSGPTPSSKTRDAKPPPQSAWMSEFASLKRKRPAPSSFGAVDAGARAPSQGISKLSSDNTIPHNQSPGLVSHGPSASTSVVDDSVVDHDQAAVPNHIARQGSRPLASMHEIQVRHPSKPTEGVGEAEVLDDAFRQTKPAHPSKPTEEEKEMEVLNDAFQQTKPAGQDVDSNHSLNRLTDRSASAERNPDAESTSLLSHQIPNIIQSTEQEFTTATIDRTGQPSWPGCDLGEIFKGHLKQMRDDSTYATRVSLGRARRFKRPEFAPLNSKLESASPYGMNGIKYTVSPFKDMKPIRDTKKTTFGEHTTVRFEAQSFAPSGSRSGKVVATCPVTSWRDDSSEVPVYIEYSSVPQNLLGSNTKQLQVWPFFGNVEAEDPAYYRPLQEEFDVVVEQRPRKLLVSQKAASYWQYFEAFLQEAGCSMDGVLKYLLDYDVFGEKGLRGRLFSVAEAYSVNDHEDFVENLLEARKNMCEDDYDCRSERWVSVFSSLPSLDDRTLWLTSIACYVFWNVTNLSPWQIARKHARAREVDQNRIEEDFRELACVLCNLHDCPYHGEVRERPESDDDAASDVTADKFDVDFPPNINFKRRVVAPSPPAEGERETSRSSGKEKSISWWMNEDNSAAWDHSRRGPFFPCHHPGFTCDDAKCSCFRDKVCCEKVCGCALNCDRRFHGCSCAQVNRRRPCQEDSCECFRMNRECHPDICGSCGVDLLLDPLNRNDQELQKGRCRNAPVQLGRAKRTLLGNSQVHGFGLYAGEPIKKDEFVGEYRGEIIGKAETERRGAIYALQKQSYLFSLNRDQEVDSQLMGSKLRFINHAAPEDRTKGGVKKASLRNLAPKIMFCNLTHRIGMYAIKDINVGDELFFNYGEDYHEQLYNGSKSDSKVVPKSHNRDLIDDFVEPGGDPKVQENDEDDDIPIRRVKANRGKPVGSIESTKPPVNTRSSARKSQTEGTRVARKTQGQRSPIGRGGETEINEHSRNPTEAAVESAKRKGRQGDTIASPPLEDEDRDSNGRNTADSDVEMEDAGRGGADEEEDDGDDEEITPRRSGRSRTKSFRLRTTSS